MRARGITLNDNLSVFQWLPSVGAGCRWLKCRSLPGETAPETAPLVLATIRRFGIPLTRTTNDPCAASLELAAELRESSAATTDHPSPYASLSPAPRRRTGRRASVQRATCLLRSSESHPTDLLPEQRVQPPGTGLPVLGQARGRGLQSCLPGTQAKHSRPR